MSKIISGFSKYTKQKKIEWLVKNYFNNQQEVVKVIQQYWNTDKKLQNIHDDFIENTISNFYMPYAVAPNFVINDKEYTIPMVTEESSVVAAVALVSKFWSTRGGFKAKVISTTKTGQVHFMYSGDEKKLQAYFNQQKSRLKKSTAEITKNMEKRGGGILDIQLKNKTDKLPDYYQLHVTFETKDSMGANFINSCLETIAKNFKKKGIEIIMSILSNYTPECLVRAEVTCKVKDFGGKNPYKLAQKFYQAVQIAQVEPYRAVTHNKGIMNGIDAITIATGNDFRAIEAAAHSYASREGQYTSLTNCEIKNDRFTFWIEIPLTLGTVGGVTSLHPMVKLSLCMLQNPTAKELMGIVASVGLAQNFAALQALISKGIQHGHMKMHLTNILNQLGATAKEKEYISDFYKDKIISHNAVAQKLSELKNKMI